MEPSAPSGQEERKRPVVLCLRVGAEPRLNNTNDVCNAGCVGLTRVSTASSGTEVRGVVSDQLKPASRSLAPPESSPYTTIVGSSLRPYGGSTWLTRCQGTCSHSHGPGCYNVRSTSAHASALARTDYSTTKPTITESVILPLRALDRIASVSKP
jgi:hypothetical protein